jgi:hypothetical protein
MCDVVLVMDMPPNAYFGEVLACLGVERGKELQGSRPSQRLQGP